MGFWIFMLIMDLLLPFAMIGFGRYFMKKAPKEINSVFGYRTSMSMKNKDTWEFAHKYCGKFVKDPQVKRLLLRGYGEIPIKINPIGEQDAKRQYC